MSETWIKECCPKCETINWMSLGDPSDFSGVDPDGYKCYKCGNIELYGCEEDYEFNAEMGEWESKEDCYWELGKENPD